MYEYTKGQGWVYSTGVHMTMHCGTRVRLEARTPELGDHYGHTPKDRNNNPWALNDGPNLQYFADAFIHVPYEGLAKCSGALSTKYHYVVFVPVEAS